MVVEETLARVCPFSTSDRQAVGTLVVTLRLTVRLEEPGDPCFPLSIALRFDYGADFASLEATQDALDRRLYDGVNAGVEAALPQLPPEGLRVIVPALDVQPSLAAVLAPDDAPALERVGAALEALAHDAVGCAWQRLSAADTTTDTGGS